MITFSRASDALRGRDCAIIPMRCQASVLCVCTSAKLKQQSRAAAAPHTNTAVWSLFASRAFLGDNGASITCIDDLAICDKHRPSAQGPASKAGITASAVPGSSHSELALLRAEVGGRRCSCCWWRRSVWVSPGSRQTQGMWRPERCERQLLAEWQPAGKGTATAHVNDARGLPGDVPAAGGAGA